MDLGRRNDGLSKRYISLQSNVKSPRCIKCVAYILKDVFKTGYVKSTNK